MDRGRLLSDAANVLVQVAGGPGMTLSEVEILMQELNRHISDQTQILFGTAVDGRMGNRLAVTLISSLAAERRSGPAAVWNQPAAMPQPTFAPVPTPTWQPSHAAQEEEEIVSQSEEFPEPPAGAPVANDPGRYSAAGISSGVADSRRIEPSASEPEPIAAQVTPQFIEPEPAPPRVILPKKKPLLAKEPKLPVEKDRPRQTGGPAIRIGHARSVRKERADHRRRPGPRRPHVFAEKRPREVAALSGRER